MSKKDVEKQQLLDKAYQIFLDVADYNSSVLIGFFKLFIDIFKENPITEAEVLISKIKEIILKLNEKEQEVITLYYGLDGSNEYKFEEIAEKLKLTHQRVNQIQKNALSKLEKSLDNITLSGIISRRENFLRIEDNNRIIELTEDQKKILKNLSINSIELGGRSHKRLKQIGIERLIDFIEIKEGDLIGIYGLGERSIKEILDKAKELLDNRDSLMKVLNINELNLSNRQLNILRKNGIITLQDLCECSDRKIKEIKGISYAGLLNVVRQKRVFLKNLI